MGRAPQPLPSCWRARMAGFKCLRREPALLRMCTALQPPALEPPPPPIVMALAYVVTSPTDLVGDTVEAFAPGTTRLEASRSPVGESAGSTMLAQGMRPSRAISLPAAAAMSSGAGKRFTAVGATLTECAKHGRFFPVERLEVGRVKE